MAPIAPMYIVDCENAAEIINKNCDDKTGVLCYKCDKTKFKTENILSAGEDIYQYAANYFYNLRRFDEMSVDKIYAIPPEKDGMGQAVWNRLLKSAGGNVICG